MQIEVFVSALLGLIALVGTLLSYYLHIKEKITAATVDAINTAEVKDKTGEEKKELAVNQVCALVPKVLKPVFPRKLIEQLVQKVFDKIKEFAIKQNKEKNDD